MKISNVGIMTVMLMAFFGCSKDELVEINNVQENKDQENSIIVSENPSTNKPVSKTFKPQVSSSFDDGDKRRLPSNLPYLHSYDSDFSYYKLRLIDDGLNIPSKGYIEIPPIRLSKNQTSRIEILIPQCVPGDQVSISALDGASLEKERFKFLEHVVVDSQNIAAVDITA